MDESVEKSCWGVTLWALAIVVAVVMVASLVMGTAPVDGISASAGVSG